MRHHDRQWVPTPNVRWRMVRDALAHAVWLRGHMISKTSVQHRPCASAPASPLRVYHQGARQVYFRQLVRHLRFREDPAALRGVPQSVAHRRTGQIRCGNHVVGSRFHVIRSHGHVIMCSVHVIGAHAHVTPPHA